MGKDKKDCFVVEFLLITELWQEDILFKRLEVGRKIYNALLGKTRRRYKEMIKTKTYRSAMAELRKLNKKNKAIKDKKKWRKSDKALYDELVAILNGLRSKYRLSEYDFHDDVKPFQHFYKKDVDSHAAQKIATRLWSAYQDVLFGDGEELHFKRYGELQSVEGKNNAAGIRFKNGYLEWLGVSAPIGKAKTPYEEMALQHEISFCRIVYRPKKGRNRFALQIVFKGVAPPKVNRRTGELKHHIGKGDVGLDIGTQTLAISSGSSVKLYELADRVQNIENEKRRIQRKIDRSRRAMNPDNFNEDGTIKKQGSKKVVWKVSNRCKKLQQGLREIQRKQAAVRKYQHECLANEIIALGDNVMVERMNFKGLQKCAQKTEKNKKGKFKPKKRFGKSLGNRAPASSTVS